MKTIFLALLLISVNSYSQCIALRARYTETRLVDDAPNPPRRENRLILSFFELSLEGVYTPAVLSNYDLWIYKAGLQFGSEMGGVLDSTGNNYPGYAWPAPRAVSYNNSFGIPYIDCDPNAATHYVVNGHELDCGFIVVSYWDIDYGTGDPLEIFPAPNVCLSFCDWGNNPWINPGQPNFGSFGGGGSPYNFYSFYCAGGVPGLVIRGVLPPDSGNIGTPLPVRFADVRGELIQGNTAKISWSNLTESDIEYYGIEKSTASGSFFSLDTLHPIKNNGERADYELLKLQTEQTALYRIKAVETNGKIIYSSVISLRWTDSNSGPANKAVLSVYPNPVTSGIFTFQLRNAPAGRYISCLVTPSGQQIKHKMIEHSGGDLTRQVDMTGLQAGIYQLLLRSASGKYSQKIFYVN